MASSKKRLKFLAIGMINIDRIAAELPEVPAPGKTIFTPQHIAERPASGHPANVVINLVKLGEDPKTLGVVACVGKDAAGRNCAKEVRRFGIHAFLQRSPLPTGQNLILVPRGKDRMFAIDPGANKDLSPAHTQRVLARHRPLFLSIRPGYSGIDSDIPLLLKNLPRTFILLDLIRPPDKKYWRIIHQVLPFVQAVHCNTSEAMQCFDTNSVEKAIRQFLKKGVRFVFITDGEKGARLITRRCAIAQPAFRLQAIDPTGCGDAFCAGVLQKFMHVAPDGNVSDGARDTLAEILLFGQAAGATAASEIGCTEGVSKKKVINLVAKQGKKIQQKTIVKKQKEKTSSQ